MFNKKAQVWVETVIYTVIGLILIALALSFVIPNVNEARDRLIVEQTLNSLQELDNKINSVWSNGDGNVRILEFTIKRGILKFDADNNLITFEIFDLVKPYSEIDEDINVGSIKIRSEKSQKANKVTLTLEYANNIYFAGSDTDVSQFTAAPVPYKFKISNIDNQYIDIEESTT